MTSMLEVLREYKHLTAKKKNEGVLPPSLEERLAELTELVRQNAPSREIPAATPDTGDMPAAAPAPVARSVTPIPGVNQRNIPTHFVPERAEGAAAKEPGRKPRRKRRQKQLTGFALLLAYLPKDAKKRQGLLWGVVLLFILLGLGAAITLGLSLDRAISNLLPAMATVGAVGWGLFYPGLMYWRERAAVKSDQHLIQPNYEAKTPVVEPVVGVFVLLAAVVWLMLSGYTKEGIGPIFGYLIGMSFSLAAVAFAAILLIRPIFDRKRDERAFSKYLEAGENSLSKQNVKRARRMFEKALLAANTELRRDSAAKALRDATAKEAEELRSKGLDDQADRLIEAVREKEGMALVTGWKEASTETPAADPRKKKRRKSKKAQARATSTPAGTLSAKDVLAQTSEPVVLQFGDVEVARSMAEPTDPDAAAAAKKASILASKGRAREALEMHVAANLPVTPEIAREAAKEYTRIGMLRSADTLYDVLGEKQIPQFYKAVAVEIAKSNDGHPESSECLRIIDILERIDETKAAAQIACRGALSDRASGGDKQQLGRRAVELCAKVGAAPPAELFEAIGQLEAAARGFEGEGNTADALRCYEKLADKLLENAGPSKYLPILSKLFLMEDRSLDDKYLKPLAEAVASSGTLNANGIKILDCYGKRHPEDRKIQRRMYDYFVESGQLDSALEALDQLQKQSDSAPTGTIQAFQALVDKFPESLAARQRLISACLRFGKVQDAVAQIPSVMLLEESRQNPEKLVQVLDALFEWGHVDPELQKEAALLKLSMGDQAGALNVLEEYVLDGGKDPEAIEHVENTLRTMLSADGAPNHDVHMRLSRFLLHRGDPENAIPLLEVCRSSSDFGFEAEVLLARAHLAASNPRSAIDFLSNAISGRGLSETPELHFELARAYEELGQINASQKIDDALDLAMPGFRQEYLGDRLMFERADTEWQPPRSFADAPNAGHPVTTLELDTGIDPARPSVVTLDAPQQAPLDLEDVLAPRYKLKKLLGSGGMGDVHLAQDLVLGRKVAIKVLRRTLATDLFLAKFKDEARIVAQLTHPGIVQVYDIGHRADWAFIVMEYVNGPNLAKLVTAATPPTRTQLLHVMADVAEAMGYAHKRNVVHRDIKPANILVALDGQAKVTDFGIAHVLAGDGEETAFSAAGMQVGTVNYMAPEQIRGTKIDGRTDIYLLGTTLYYCLGRKYPFGGDAIAIKKIQEDPTPISKYVGDLTKELFDLVMSCIAREPDDRVQTMEEVSVRLRGVPDAVAEQRTELLK